MAEVQGFSGLFDAVNGDRLYRAADLSRLLRGIVDDGYLPGVASELSVTATSPPSMAVRVRAGEVWIQGFHFRQPNDTWTTLTIPAADASLDRVDRIVMRLDLNTRRIAPAVRVGTPATDPTPRSMVQDLDVEGLWELSPARVEVPAGANRVENGAAGQAYITSHAGEGGDGLGWPELTVAGHGRQHEEGNLDPVSPHFGGSFPRMHIFQAAAGTSIGSHAEQAIVMNSADRPGNVGDLRGPTQSSLVAPVDGWYDVGFHLRFVREGGDGTFVALIRHTSGGLIGGQLGYRGDMELARGEHTSGTASLNTVTPTAIWSGHLQAGARLDFFGYQNVGREVTVGRYTHAWMALRQET